MSLACTRSDQLDLSLTRDIDNNPVRRALAASLVAFAREIGATIVAEGIETRAELESARARGHPRPGLLPGPARARPGAWVGGAWGRGAGSRRREIAEGPSGGRLRDALPPTGSRTIGVSL